MKKSDIPQDEGPLKGWTREVCYAKNEDGKYERGLSAGWSVKNDALDRADTLAVTAIDRRAFDFVAGNQACRILDIGILATGGGSIFLQHWDILLVGCR